MAIYIAVRFFLYEEVLTIFYYRKIINNDFFVTIIKN